MANFIKWLGAGLGFAVGGPIGSVLGYVVGNFIEGLEISNKIKTELKAITPSNFTGI